MLPGRSPRPPTLSVSAARANETSCLGGARSRRRRAARLPERLNQHKPRRAQKEGGHGGNHGFPPSSPDAIAELAERARAPRRSESSAPRTFDFASSNAAGSPSRAARESAPYAGDRGVERGDERAVDGRLDEAGLDARERRAGASGRRSRAAVPARAARPASRPRRARSRAGARAAHELREHAVDGRAVALVRAEAARLRVHAGSASWRRPRSAPRRTGRCRPPARPAASRRRSSPRRGWSGRRRGSARRRARGGAGRRSAAPGTSPSRTVAALGTSSSWASSAGGRTSAPSASAATPARSSAGWSSSSSASAIESASSRPAIGSGSLEELPVRP